MNAIPIVCLACWSRGSVNRVTANLRCACGSTDIDLDMGQKTAKPMGPGTGWGPHRHSPTEGWSSYEGPTPGRNNEPMPLVNDNMVCPACHGSGWDPIDSTIQCRECNGAGVVNPPTGQPPVRSWDATTQEVRSGGAGWHTAGRPSSDPFGSVEDHIRSTAPGYGTRTAPAGPFSPDKADTFYPRMPNASPNVKTRPEHDYDTPTGKPYQMDSAMCPNCGHAPTQLVKDSHEDAWWHCPSCGPLANIDKNPEVNPFSPGPGFTPDRKMKTGRLAALGRKTGKLIAIADTVSATNPGLTLAEVLSVARGSLILAQERV